jgi:plastocyanin
MHIKIVLLAVLAMAVASPIANAEEWGNLSGTFVYGGDVPAEKLLSATKDQEVCGKEKLVNEALLVNSTNKGIANVVGYLYLKKKETAPVHESYAETEKTEVTLDNIACRFDPHVTAMRTTQTLVIGNQDSVGHNTKIDAAKNPAINDIVPANGTTKKTFSEAERLPIRVSCSVHPWMTGWLLVKDNPYFAVSDTDGKFEIKNLPVGKWTFQFWHEGPGYIKEVKKGGADETWKKGRVEFEIKAGDNDLGEIEIPASIFE